MFCLYDQLLQSALFLLRLTQSEQQTSTTKLAKTDSTRTNRFASGIQCFGPLLHILAGLRLYAEISDNLWIELIRKKQMSFSTKLITRLSHFRIYTSDRFATLAHFFAQDLNESVTADSEEHHKNDQETSSSSALSRRRHRLSMDTIPYGDSTTPSSSFDNYSTHPVAKMLNLESKIPLTEIFDNLFHNIWHGRCYI